MNGIGRLGRLVSLYSRFRPIRPEVEHRIFRPHPAGNAPGHPNTSTIFPSAPLSSNAEPEGLVSHSVHLDSHELFSQLCVVTNLVQLGFSRGVFYSFVNVADGVVRIWREWLAKRANLTQKNVERSDVKSIDLEEVCEKKCKVAHADAENTETEASTLWIDNHQNVGVRVRIAEKKWMRNAPVLLHRDEDPAVTYTMEYEGLYGI